MKNIKLDKYEKEIENNAHEYKKASVHKIAKIEGIIDQINEKKNISLRVNSQDLNQIKIKAEKEGIPYQTLISSVIHKFVTEQLVDQNNIIKSIQLIKNN
ncbi:antitoxin [Candidatus Poribacteria bacterium]|nr:antitoxin [Candidatus Poribacteria bacterium]